MYRVPLTYLLFFALNFTGWAQAVQFKHITINEGLTHNHVTSIFKAADGFLWIGGPAGLNRLDGHAVRVYKNRSGNDGSLKDNAVTQIFEGPQNHLWVRTGLGMNVLDTRKDIFLGNTDSLLVTYGITPGNILDIRRDKNGHYWFLHAEEGLFRYDARENRSTKYSGRQKARPTAMALGGKSTVWVIYADGSLETVNALTLETQSVRKLEIAQNAEYRLLVDRNDDPWVYTANTPSGVFWWPDFSQPPLHFNSFSASARLRLNNNTVMGVAEDQEGRIWIATDHGGVNLFDPKSQKMNYLMYEEFDDRSLNHNGTSTVMCDADGMVWIGTYKGGVNYYHHNLIQFPVYRHHSTAPASIPYDDVNRLVEDKNGNLWIGTNGGGLIFYDKQKNTYRQYLHSPDDPHSLGSNVIVSLLLDRHDNLWVGTYHGGLNLFKNGRFIRYLHDPADPATISNNSVWELYEDSKGRFWIGTLFGGINLMNRSTGKFQRPGPDFTGPSATYICAIMEDSAGRIWFGSATGIEILEKDNIISYVYDPAQKEGLSNAYISDLLQDSKGRIWVATRDGLNLFDKGRFLVLRESEGLRDNTIHTLLEDNAGKIWMSTSKGLSVVSDTREAEWVIRNFDQHDGLQSIAFNENAAVKLRSGELIFGGPSGFNRIRPEDISHEETFPKPVISDLLLFNRRVNVGETVEGRVLLNEAMEYTDEIVLKYDQNVFSLSISPLYFLHPERVRIKYTLEGFSREWLELDANSRLATFTNLSAGEYIFNVSTSTDGEQWSAPVTLLKIVIRPPFWLTGWAYAFYMLCIAALLFAVRFMERRRQYTRFVVQQEREEARRLKELDQLKTKFFTNVSHEFRTPVSLIISPIEKLAREEEDPGRKMHLDLVHRNARRLLNLVNQLLDFRKVDTRSLQLQNTEGDIMAQVADHARSFLDMAESKEITYEINISDGGMPALFDHEKLERIVFNLLSNAFKFTPVGGKVSIAAELAGTDDLHLVVEDTGIGISEEARAKIFERYYQDDILKSLLNQGSGIGLSITREYIDLMGGTITVESEPDKGSRFIVGLPVNRAVGETTLPLPAPRTEGKNSGKRVLVVEDNDDFRFYILDNLREHYQVEEARNFTEGWDKTLAFHPDIVVSDVNMPGNTGIELCRKIKADNRTMHIPVILLTALTADNYQLEGTEAGAVDYIVKPFNVELLLSKIKSHIRQKATFEKTYRKQLAVEPVATEVESLDEKFMRKTLEIVEKNISNTLFSVEMLAEEMNVSRVGLYKKVFTLTGYSPSEFIRNIRLKRAARLLEETGLTVAEVAYEVGFNNPKVFSRYFKDIFGKLPSDYKKGH